ncbi:MAG: hypothetical protein MMC23_007156 [Stictis urceolatum]|nr:hypothetical protein [Stictis urceolata]
MHSSLVRIQNVFGFFTTVAFTVAAFVAISVVLIPQDPSASIKLRNVQVVKGRPHYYSTKKEEYAHIRFDLDADFTSLFNWNTKQLFVWVQAVYPGATPSSPPSQAIIWDTIINSPSQANPPSVWALINRNPYDSPPPKSSKSKSSSKSASKSSKEKPTSKAQEPVTPGLLKLSNVKPKYQITDVSGRIAERGNVTLEVGWNVQPWVGALTWTQRTPFYKWAGMSSGRSEAFDLPVLKGKKVETTGSGEVPAAGKAEPIVGR